MSQPPALDPEARDILRVSLVGSEWHFSIAADVFEEPGAWGDVLADIARQIAASVKESEGTDPAATLRAIGDVFVEELSKGFPGASE